MIVLYTILFFLHYNKECWKQIFIVCKIKTYMLLLCYQSIYPLLLLCHGCVVATITLWWCLCRRGVAFAVTLLWFCHCYHIVMVLSSWFHHHCHGVAFTIISLQFHHCSHIIAVPLLSHCCSFVVAIAVLPSSLHCHGVCCHFIITIAVLCKVYMWCSLGNELHVQWNTPALSCCLLLKLQVGPLSHAPSTYAQPCSHYLITIISTLVPPHVRRVQADRSKVGHDPRREHEGAKERGEREVWPETMHTHDRTRSVMKTQIRGV